MTILKHVVDESGWVTFDYLHPKLREAEAAVHKLAHSPNRTIVLTELAELIERTVPAPKPKPKSSRQTAEMDDDIPF